MLDHDADFVKTLNACQVIIDNRSDYKVINY